MSTLAPRMTKDGDTYFAEEVRAVARDLDLAIGFLPGIARAPCAQAEAIASGSIDTVQGFDQTSGIASEGALMAATQIADRLREITEG